MQICIVTPAPPRSYQGNRMTAERWRQLFEELGHRAGIVESYEGQKCDVLVALHARRSAASVLRFVSEAPGAPVVLALTGTDLYPDLATSGVSLSVLQMADRIVVLQDLGVDQVPAFLRDRTRVILQSAEPPEPGRGALHDEDSFMVAVIAHLRPVKDPLLAAAAVRMLPPASKIRVVHLGAELDAELGRLARSETADNPRYQWVGELPHDVSMRTLRSCSLLALTSLTEGGANVVGEAIAVGVPVVSSRIDGSVGLLGDDYPGYFTPSDAGGLADLLWRIENDEQGLLRELRRRCQQRLPLVARSRERQAWRALLGELAVGPATLGGRP